MGMGKLEVSNNRINRIGTSGFTIVEFIIASLLIAIIGGVVMSRFADSNSLNGNVAQDIIISMARTALQNSLGRSQVVMTITPAADGNSATIETEYGSGPATTIRSETISLRSVTLSGDINETASCEATPGGTTLTNTAVMTLAFGELGDLDTSGVTGSTGAITSGLRICVNNVTEDSVCVSPSGFAYAGDCDV